MTAIALPPPLAAGRPWPPEAPAQPSLPRCLLLATMLHLLLVLWVGTEAGGGGGRATGAVPPGPIQIRLQGAGPSAAGAAPTRGPATASVLPSPRATGRPDAARLPAPDSARRPTAPEPGPVPAPLAGQAREGAVLRGREAGLPAAPTLADLQSPPAGVRGPTEIRRQGVDAPGDRAEAGAASVVAAPRAAAPEREEPVRAPRTPPVTTPEPARELPDATPSRQPALVEAERAVVPRAEEPTQGVLEATRKRPIAPAVAPPAAPAVAAPASAAPVVAPPVRAAATEALPDAPIGRPAPDSADARAASTPSPTPDSPRAPPALRGLEAQTRAVDQPLVTPQAAALPAPPTMPLEPPRTATPAPASPTPQAQAVPPPAAVIPPPLAAPTPRVAPAPVPAPATAAAAPPPVSAAPVATPALSGAAVAPAGTVPGREGPASPRPTPAAMPQGLPTPGGADAALRGVISIPAPPALPASAPPGRLNLELPRAGSIAPSPARSSGTVLRLEPPPLPDTRSKLARDIEKAGRTDCRTAHADKGLIGAAALAADALKKDGGCKW